MQVFRFGQFDLVVGDEEAVIHSGQGVFYKGVVFARTQEYADRRLIARRHLVCPVVTDIGVQLTEMLLTEVVHFQFYEDMAFEHTVVEDEVYEKILIANEQSFLSRFKAEAMTEFDKEIL